MQANQEGPKKDRSWVTPLVPPARLETIVLKSGATVMDTMKKFPGVIRENMHQAKEVAKHLKGADLSQTCTNIFRFLFDHFRYVEDEKGKEQIRTFSRLVHDGYGDCDCFVCSASALLLNLGIRHFLRVTKYRRDANYSHIYVVVPLNQRSTLSGLRGRDPYLTIDRVAGLNNFEVPYTDKTDIPMDLEVLNGLPSRPTIDQLEFAYQDRDGFAVFQDPTALGAVATKAEIAAQQAGMSVADWEAKNRAEFIQRTGMTPEQWAKQVQNNMAATQAANAQQDKDIIKKLRDELLKRGVNIPSTVTSKDDLIKLLNQNPPPKPAAQFANGVNKYNPLAITLRTGVLLIMKGNLMKIGEHLRWAYLSFTDAIRKGIDPEKYKQLLKLKDVVQKIYFAAGGDQAKLREAILGGKGNGDKQIPFSPTQKNLSGLAGPVEPGSVRAILGDDLYFSEGANMLPQDKGFNGLGEVVAGAAIAAATAALTTVAAIIKQIGDLKAKGGNTAQIIGSALEQAASGASAISTALDKGEGNNAKVQEAIQKAQTRIQAFQTISSGSDPSQTANTQYSLSTGQNDTTDYSNYGEADKVATVNMGENNGENGDQRTLKDKIMDNIVPIGIVAALAVGGIAYAATRSGSDKSLKGTPPAPKPKRRKKNQAMGKIQLKAKL
ncbi:MAG: hypothetical protein H6581_20605 [Bacteroidia bacterium]|nr:hypothetical protein [Bacteroidia bacterium]